MKLRANGLKKAANATGGGDGLQLPAREFQRHSGELQSLPRGKSFCETAKFDFWRSRGALPANEGSGDMNHKFLIHTSCGITAIIVGNRAAMKPVLEGHR